MKKALITGGSSGIGEAFALKLAAEGYSVTIVARNKEALEKTAGQLPKIGGASHRIIPADLGSDEGGNAIAKEIAETKYDLLVNNAGIGGGSGFAEIPFEKIESMISLNCTSLAALSHAYLQNAVSGDAIINIASVVSFIPYPGLAAYSATKAFVLSFSEALHGICGKKGIRILAVCPGLTKTNFFKAAGETSMEKASAFMQEPGEVVEEAMRALRKNKVFVVTGWKNKIAAQFAKHAPARLLVWAAGKAQF